jgi:hypothetical protein
MKSLDIIRKSLAKVQHQKQATVVADDDEQQYVSGGPDMLLGSTEKILAVSRGQTDPDERDDLSYKRVRALDTLMNERIHLDPDRLMQKAMRQISRHGSLKPIGPGFFNAMGEKMIVGNTLSMALEEINPTHLLEQARRITQMGLGGIGSPQAITSEAQNLHPSEFGFLSALEGPECLVAGSQVLTEAGWVAWEDVQDDAKFACRINGVLEYHKAERIVRESYRGKILIAESETIKMATTPNHRVLYHHGGGNCKFGEARDVYGKSIKIPIRHEPYVGNVDWTEFELPSIPKGGNAQRDLGPFDIGDWCEFMGWFLSEGNIAGQLCLTQCPEANPENHKQIVDLVRRMGLVGGKFSGTCMKFAFSQKQLMAYFEPYQGKRCYDKWIPEELFEAPVWARERMLDSLLKGDGRDTGKRKCYCTVSLRLAESVQRLAFSLGYTAFIRIEKDMREHVHTTNYVVSIHRQHNRQPMKADWRTEDYDGMVYCATVPGGVMHVRGKVSTSGFWTGNSERIGIDTRAAWGAKLGSDGRIYQRFHNRRTNKYEWLSPQDLRNKIIGLPD